MLAEPAACLEEGFCDLCEKRWNDTCCRGAGHLLAGQDEAILYALNWEGIQDAELCTFILGCAGPTAAET